MVTEEKQEHQFTLNTVVAGSRRPVSNGHKAPSLELGINGCTVRPRNESEVQLAELGNPAEKTP